MKARDYKDATDLVTQPIPYTSSSFASYKHGVGTLRSAGGDLGGGSETLVTQPTYAIQGSMIGRNDNAGRKAMASMKRFALRKTLLIVTQ